MVPMTLISTVLFGCLTGCMYVDYGYRYRLALTLADASGQPLSKIKVYADDDPDCSPATWETTDKLDRTDSAGRVSTTATTGIKWGEAVPPVFGSLFRHSPPIPANPKTLYLWLEIPVEGWVQHELTIHEENILKREPAELWIKLDRMSIKEAVPAKTRPAGP